MPPSDSSRSIGRGICEPWNQTANGWKLRTQTLSIRRLPLVMGIVNVTPDSFSDGGQFADSDAAVDHALQLVAEGASILDIGGESTRPYSSPVETEDEICRVLPVIQGIVAQSTTPISVDTSKAAVAQAAIDAGAEIINDVSGLERDPAMLEVARKNGAGVCAMHMLGTPQTMQDDPQYNDVVREIHAYLAQRKSKLLESGIELERICLDPGIGFGKTHQHNLELLSNCDQFLDLGCPILIGHSRKGFIGKMIGDTLADRDPGTLAISLLLAQKGIQIIRVHEVEATVKALNVFDAAGGLDGKVARLSD